MEPSPRNPSPVQATKLCTETESRLCASLPGHLTSKIWHSVEEIQRMLVQWMPVTDPLLIWRGPGTCKLGVSFLVDCFTSVTASGIHQERLSSSARISDSFKSRLDIMREQVSGKQDLWASAVAPLHVKFLRVNSEICFHSNFVIYIASVFGFDTTSSIAFGQDYGGAWLYQTNSANFQGTCRRIQLFKGRSLKMSWFGLSTLRVTDLINFIQNFGRSSLDHHIMYYDQNFKP